jgi:hypothetical protein
MYLYCHRTNISPSFPTELKHLYHRGRMFSVPYWHQVVSCAFGHRVKIICILRLFLSLLQTAFCYSHEKSVGDELP